MRVITLVLFTILFISCASTKKIKHTTTEQIDQVDSSSYNTQYNKETTITEKSTQSIYTTADSISAAGSFSSEDTATYTQESHSNGVSVKTTIKPRVKDGKINGYDVDSKAKSEPKKIDIPIDKTTTIKETANQQKRSTVTNTEIKTESTLEKVRKGWSFGTTLIIFAFLVGITLIIFFFKYLRQ